MHKGYFWNLLFMVDIMAQEYWIQLTSPAYNVSPWFNLQWGQAQMRLPFLGNSQFNCRLSQFVFQHSHAKVGFVGSKGADLTGLSKQQHILFSGLLNANYRSLRRNKQLTIETYCLLIVWWCSKHFKWIFDFILQKTDFHHHFFCHK